MNHCLSDEMKLIEVCISSRVRPLVSGTSRSTNRTVRPQMLANMKKVPVMFMLIGCMETIQGYITH